MALQINVGGTWKTISNSGLQINVGGVWKTPDRLQINVGGTWKTVWAGPPQVSPASTGVTTDNGGVGTACYAGITFNGGLPYQEESCTFAGSYTVNRGTWLDVGSSDEVWVQRVISSGSLNSNDPGSGRIRCDTSPYFEVVDTSLVGGPVTCTLTFNFYDAASGGSLIGSSGSLTLSANRSA
jgi:hypothetical protein